MNIDYSHITPHHQKTLRPVVDSFSHMFPSWVDRVVFFYDEENPGGASTSPYKPYKRTTIYLSKELLSEPPEKVDNYIAHEIAHSYNEGLLRIIHEYLPLLSLEDDTRKLFHKQCIDAIECQTEDLAKLFCREDEDE
jgi:hypothetical protein